MWDSNALLQLLKSMPKKLSKENLEKIQMLIDADKYKNSLLSGFDLCDMNMYAPFCRGCSKTSIYPCAIAYVNMMKADGMEIEIAAKPVTAAPQPSVEEPTKPEVKAEEPAKIEATTIAAVPEEPVAEEIAEPVKSEIAVAREPEQKPEPLSEPEKTVVKRKIRIAVARKKI